MRTVVWVLVLILGLVCCSALYRWARNEIFGHDAATHAALAGFLKVMGGIIATAFAIGVFTAAILLWLFAPAMP